MKIDNPRFIVPSSKYFLKNNVELEEYTTLYIREHCKQFVKKSLKKLHLRL